MIIDTLENLSLYESVHPLFKDVVEFIKNNDLNKLELGKYKIKGDELFVNIVMAKGKQFKEAVLETHKKMIDIQVPISTAENFGYTPTCYLSKEAEYDEANDITKYPRVEPDCFIPCQMGMFAIFFPQDGHAPCVSGHDEIKKAIFKVLA